MKTYNNAGYAAQKPGLEIIPRLLCGMAIPHFLPFLSRIFEHFYPSFLTISIPHF
jgi:hypothetical protein